MKPDAKPIAKPGDLIPTVRGRPVRVTSASMQQRPRSDGPGVFGFVLVFTEPLPAPQEDPRA